MARETFDMLDTNDDEAPTFDLVDDENPFFAPVATDALESLLGQYKATRVNVERLHSLMNGGELSHVVHYFIDGNCGDDRLHRSLYVDKMFALDGAIGALNSAFWSKALALTDVYELMPQDRKNAWNAQLRNPEGVKAKRGRLDSDSTDEWESEPLPEFEDGTVRATIASLLHARAQFLSERVDGIFRALSGTHVTNAPEAFGKRFIISRMFDSYGTVEHSTAGYLHDLRCVIARFMGREEPKHFGTTDDLLKRSRHCSGKWVFADGGALKIRTYNVGTAHMEVHPDLAYRLNQILAFMHPAAIPAQFRRKPTRKAKDFTLLGRPLPFAVLNDLSRTRQATERVSEWPERYRQIQNSRCFESMDTDKAVRSEAERVLQAIGGVESGWFWQFEYDPADVLGEILASGCIPDAQSHQFYPTPEKIGEAAAAFAAIEPEHTVLEPSAGNGDLAAMLPRDRLQCVEVSALRCSVLRARGFDAIEADFIDWAGRTSARFDRVVSNPPFSESRWQAHVQAAYSLLKPGGRLVAVLPASARGKALCAGAVEEFGQRFDNEFAGTSVSVVLYAATKQT